MYVHADLELQLLHILLNHVFIIWRDSCYFCVGKLVNMDKMSFPWIITVTSLDREARAYSVDQDQMSHNTLCNQGLQYSTFSQQCLDKSVGTIVAL